MASLFALGVMSIIWMAFVAGLIALEKTLPWRRPTYGTAAVLLVLGVLILASPQAIPWLTVPGEQPMQMMPSDGRNRLGLVSLAQTILRSWKSLLLNRV